MRPPEPGPAVHLCRLLPPYRHVEPLPPTPPRSPPWGMVLLLDVIRPDCDALLSPERVLALRQQWTTAALVLRVPEMTRASLRLAESAGRLHIRAVVHREEPLAESLRARLTQTDGACPDVVEWLQLRGLAFSPTAGALLQRLFSEAPRHPHLSTLLGASGLSERTARHRFHREQLPAPREWHRAARALHAALCIQAAGDAPLRTLVSILGFHDPSGVSRQLSRAFRLTTRALRGTLGWEWVLDRWLTRARGRREAA